MPVNLQRFREHPWHSRRVTMKYGEVFTAYLAGIVTGLAISQAISDAVRGTFVLWHPNRLSFLVALLMTASALAGPVKRWWREAG